MTAFTDALEQSDAILPHAVAGAIAGVAVCVYLVLALRSKGALIVGLLLALLVILVGIAVDLSAHLYTH